MSTPTTSDAALYEPIFVARQPIFDTGMDIWGYELLFRHSGQAGTAQILDPDQATAKVIADGLALALDGLPPGKRLLINFPANLILKEAALALPKDVCVIEILETVDPTPEILDACKKLKAEGYTLALDDFVGQPGYEELIKLTDIVKVEILGQETKDVIKTSQMLRKLGVELLAEKVEDKAQHQLTKTLGYLYFQGYYFSKPVIVPGRKISSSVMARVRILQELSKEDFEVKAISKIFNSDLSLSYRLLQYLNSAAFSLPSKITSISQAVTILGSRQLRQWLMVVMLSDMDPSPKAAELTFASVQRGRFLELLTASMARPDYPPDTMFMLGLFSRLDALLGQPMAEVVKPMPLSDEIKDALLGVENKASARLHLLDALDRGDWEAVDAMVDELGLDHEKAAVAHARSSAWAQGLLVNSRTAQSV